MDSTTKKIESFLVTAQIITEDQWKEAFKISEETGERIEKVLVKKEFITQQEAFEILELVYDAPYISLVRELVEIEALMLIPEDVARTNKLLPISVTPNQLVVAMANPQDLVAIDNIRYLTSLPVRVFFAFEEDIEEAIDLYYSKFKLLPTPDVFTSAGKVRKTVKIAPPSRGELTVKLDVPSKLTPLTEKPALEMVDDIFKHAIVNNATDIHFEPVEVGYLLRYRIFGRLYDVQTISATTAQNIPLRLKVMSDINISDPFPSLTNDCEIKVEDQLLKVRVSTLRTSEGERINCKILNQKHTFANFWNLVLDEKCFRPLGKMLSQNKGLLLLSSPPGSDSEATLFAILNMIMDPSRSIIVIGKAMKFQFKNISYLQVSDRFTYVDALKSVTSQDPDIILIDKLCDRDAIELAFRAALSGHIVLSTLETFFHSAETICGLMKKGISPFWIASGLNGVITQRWANRICPHCKMEYYLTEGDWRWEFLNVRTKSKKIKLYKGRGCNFCNNTGYYGFVGIYEVLNMENRIKMELIRRPIPESIHKLAQKEGMESLKDNTMKYVWNGQLFLDDVFQIVI